MLPLKLAIPLAGVLTIFLVGLVIAEVNEERLSTELMLEVLDQRGIPIDNIIDRSELLHLMNKTGVSRTEILSVKQQMETAEMVQDTTFDNGPDFDRIVNSERTAWLIWVTVKKYGAFKMWPNVRAKAATLGIRIGIIRCTTASNWCEERRWDSSRLLLILPPAPGDKSGKVSTYTGKPTERRVIRWVHDRLTVNVDETFIFRKWLLDYGQVNDNSIRVVLVTNRTSPPPFYSALNVQMDPAVSLRWIHTRFPERLFAILSTIRDISFQVPDNVGYPIILIFTADGVELYGKRDEECMTMSCLRMYLDMTKEPFSFTNLLLFLRTRFSFMSLLLFLLCCFAVVAISMAIMAPQLLLGFVQGTVLIAVIVLTICAILYMGWIYWPVLMVWLASIWDIIGTCFQIVIIILIIACVCVGVCSLICDCIREITMYVHRLLSIFTGRQVHEERLPPAARMRVEPMATPRTYPRSRSSARNQQQQPRLQPVSDEGDRCVICLEELLDDRTIARFAHCAHAFHASCLFTWFLTNQSCPLCRHPL